MELRSNTLSSYMRHYALQIDLGDSRGALTLDTASCEQSSQRQFQIADRSYAFQRQELKDQNPSNPNEEVLFKVSAVCCFPDGLK